MVDVESLEICTADSEERIEVMNVSFTEWRLVTPICRQTLPMMTAVRHPQIKRNCGEHGSCEPALERHHAIRAGEGGPDFPR
ncbi:hypothetical protein D3C78_1176300 [compost metagenome]